MIPREHRQILRYFYALVVVVIASVLILLGLNNRRHNTEVEYRSRIERFHVASVLLAQEIFDELDTLRSIEQQSGADPQSRVAQNAHYLIARDLDLLAALQEREGARSFVTLAQRAQKAHADVRGPKSGSDPRESWSRFRFRLQQLDRLHGVTIEESLREIDAFTKRANSIELLATLVAIVVVGAIVLQLNWLVRQRLRELREADAALKTSERRLVTSLDEKELLLREIHHRVKNNMQIVCSLLNLGGDTDNPVLTEAILESQNRIRALALIHENLYRSESVARLDFKDYIESLATDLFRSYKIDSQVISLTVEAEDVALEMESAIPCGLVISELISNALKHAFPEGGPGEIRILFRESLPGEYELTVRDDGFGMSADLDWEDPGSLGLRLVKDLAIHQLGGIIDCRTQPGQGTTFHMEFKALRYKPRLEAHV